MFVGMTTRILEENALEIEHPKMATIFVQVPEKDVMPFNATASVESVEKCVRNVHMLEGGALRERETGRFVVEGDNFEISKTYDFVRGIPKGK